MANGNGNLLQQAMDAVNRITNNNQASDQDKQAAHSAIQAAYNDATPAEKQQLQQLEQQLQQHQLS
ncbi:Protein of unknown function [Oceanobacillus limi]|uniref:DUF3813 domain-containing protein n=1 Tax=Oceanobacillus limi TaxID=930131 RepID=A0A1I0C719_9BACI|nr:DUF3813 family protein [Oceanobacillus limi]SET14728.1 Protein of unknown function [Oceanobacillus limi]